MFVTYKSLSRTKIYISMNEILVMDFNIIISSDRFFIINNINKLWIGYHKSYMLCMIYPIYRGIFLYYNVNSGVEGGFWLVLIYFSNI